MKRLFKGVIFVVFLGFLSGCGGSNEIVREQSTDEQTPTASSGEAEAKYLQSCANCHGGELVKKGTPDLIVIGDKYSKDEILDIIIDGKGSMSGGFLTGDDAEIVAAWLADKK